MRIVTSNDNTVATLPRTVQNATERPPKKPLPPSSGSEASATTTTKDVVKLNCQVCRLEINRAWFFDAGDQSLTLRSSPSSGYQVIFMHHETAAAMETIPRMKFLRRRLY